MRRWQVEDPHGFIHILEYDRDGNWHGITNISHVITGSHVDRGVNTTQLLSYILQDEEVGDWKGYTWLKL